jgi:hypothetical protein
MAMLLPGVVGGQVQPPQIETPPGDQVVRVGQSLTFTVVARGSEPLTYQWLRDGATLPGATTDQFFLVSVSMGDAGDYAVRVRNEATTVTSGGARLSVIPPAPGSLEVGFGVGLGANDVVTVVKLAHDGRVLLGGHFTMVHGVPRNGLARLNAEGSLDLSFNPAFSPGSIWRDAADARLAHVRPGATWGALQCAREQRAGHGVERARPVDRGPRGRQTGRT